MKRLEGKVAIVTGGADGIGRACVLLFQQEGAKVVIGDIADDFGEKVAAVAPDDIAYKHCDVCNEQEIADLVAFAVEKFGKLDIMVNNAGSIGAMAGLVDIEAEDLLYTENLLLNAAVWGHKYPARQFIAQGTGGSIVTIASIGGMQGGHSPLGYSLCKQAMLALVRHAAGELGPKGIRSNAIAPGITMTSFNAVAAAGPSLRYDSASLCEMLEGPLANAQPLGRVGQPIDIANAVLFMASDESSWITGTYTAVDGGMTAVQNGTWNADSMAITGQWLAERHPEVLAQMGPPPTY